MDKELDSWVKAAMKEASVVSRLKVALEDIQDVSNQTLINKELRCLEPNVYAALDHIAGIARRGIKEAEAEKGVTDE